MADTQISGFALRTSLDGTEKIVLSSGDADNTHTTLAHVVGQLPASYGFFDYNDSATSTTPITFTDSVEELITNDGLGTSTNKLYPPVGVTDVWDANTSSFDWTSLSLGDRVGIRFDGEVTTTSPNQQVSIFLKLAIGATPYTIAFVADRLFKSAGTHQLNDLYNVVYMGDTSTLDNPAQLILVSDDAGSLVVRGWFCDIIQRQKV